MKTFALVLSLSLYGSMALAQPEGACDIERSNRLARETIALSKDLVGDKTKRIEIIAMIDEALRKVCGLEATMKLNNAAGFARFAHAIDLKGAALAFRIEANQSFAKDWFAGLPVGVRVDMKEWYQNSPLRASEDQLDAEARGLMAEAIGYYEKALALAESPEAGSVVGLEDSLIKTLNNLGWAYESVIVSDASKARGYFERSDRIRPGGFARERLNALDENVSGKIEEKE